MTKWRRTSADIGELMGGDWIDVATSVATVAGLMALVWAGVIW